jgi:glycosyltransferase involved in cell wall biosynthesis
MRVERALGFRSCFNFIPEGDYSVSAQLRRELAENGFEVGVHDLHHDGKLYRSHSEFRKNAEQINNYVKMWGAAGFRSGFMLNRLEWMHHLDVQYDASTFDTDPFEPQPYGVGTIFPFWVPRPPASRKRFAGKGLSPGNGNGGNEGYVELPYTLPQDSTLFLLLQERHPDIWFQKADWVAAHGGMVLLDTHPDYMAFNGTLKEWEYPIELYTRFLEYIKTRYSGRYWHALPREAAAYASRVLPRDNESWAIRNVNGGAKRPRAAVLLFSHYPSDPRPRREAEALARTGYEVEVISLTQEPDEPRQSVIEAVKVQRLPIQHRRGGKGAYIVQYGKFISTCFVLLALRSLRKPYKLVHVHNMPDVLVFAALVPKMLGAKVILDLHDPMPELMMTIFGMHQQSFGVRLLKFLERRSIGFANAVLTPNEAFARLFATRSCGNGKLRVVMNSPDEKLFGWRETVLTQPTQPTDRPFGIMYHGALVERHGLDVAVDALTTIRRSVAGAELHVYGRPTPYLHRVMEDARAKGLESSVKFHGPKNLEQIAQAIDECDVGIIPNRKSVFTEINLPTRIFEYLARGKPVIAPRTEGIRDYFGDEQIIYFDLGNAEELASKVIFVANHPERVVQIVKEGQRVYQNHRWCTQRSVFLDVVSELSETN